MSIIAKFRSKKSKVTNNCVELLKKQRYSRLSLKCFPFPFLCYRFGIFRIKTSQIVIIVWKQKVFKWVSNAKLYQVWVMFSGLDFYCESQYHKCLPKLGFNCSYHSLPSCHQHWLGLGAHLPWSTVGGLFALRWVTNTSVARNNLLHGNFPLSTAKAVES